MEALEIHIWKMVLRHEDITEVLCSENFLDPALWDHEGYTDEIYIDRWVYKSRYGDIPLTDIYGYFGDNQVGGVFISDKMILENHDTQLTIFGDSLFDEADIGEFEALKDEMVS